MSTLNIVKMLGLYFINSGTDDGNLFELLIILKNFFCINKIVFKYVLHVAPQTILQNRM